jgi:hypothetical protein
VLLLGFAFGAVELAFEFGQAGAKGGDQGVFVFRWQGGKQVFVQLAGFGAGACIGGVALKQRDLLEPGCCLP